MSNDTTIDLSQYFVNRGEIEDYNKLEDKKMPCGKKKPKKK